MRDVCILGSKQTKFMPRSPSGLRHRPVETGIVGSNPTRGANLHQ